MTHRERSAASIAWLGVAGLLAASLVFAPVVAGGWCADAADGGTSVCGSFQRSLIGIDTNIWLWLGSMAVVVVVTLAALRRRRTSAR